MTHSPFESAFFQIIDFLESKKITYALIGAWANNVWGRPRGTVDIDFVILMSEKEFEALKAEVEENKVFSIDNKWLDHNPMIRHLQKRFLCGGIPIDLMLPRDEHDKMMLKRREPVHVLNREVFVSSKEDTILQKIKVGRPRDFEDAAAVLKKHKSNIDRNYLQQWADRLHINDKLTWILEK